MASRPQTQSAPCPRKRATRAGVKPSSSRSEQTTSASSSAVVVRGGALVTSSRRLWAGASPGDSTTTGMRHWPASFQRARRLRPSMTS